MIEWDKLIYKSMLVRKQLVKIYNCHINLIYNLVLDVEKSINDLDRYLSLPLFFLLLCNQIFCIANICQVALGSHIFDSLCVFVYGAFNLIILCYICNIIQSDMLIDSIKGTQCEPIVVQALSHFVHTQEMQDSSL